MKTVTFVAILLFALTRPACEAASIPWIGNISTSITITIPPGKILIIEQIGSVFSSVQTATFTVTGPGSGGIGGAFTSTFGVQLTGLTKLPSPIRLGPSMTISGGFPSQIVLFGTVIDSSEFLASANPIVNGLSSESGQLAALIDSRTTEATSTIGEASNDLQTWSTAGVTVAKSASNPRVSKIITAKDSPKKFVRAKLAARALNNTRE